MSARDGVDFWFERSTFVTAIFAAMVYGLHFTIFIGAIYFTLHSRQRIRTHLVVYLVFCIVIFVTATLNMICSIYFNTSAWVDHRDYPTGTTGFLLDERDGPVPTVADITAVIAYTLANGFLLYRVAVLWSKKWYIVTFPTLFYLACIVLSVLVAVQTATGSPKGLTHAIWIVPTLLPICYTVLISSRILTNGRSLTERIGKESAQTFTGFRAIAVESALPVAILSVILVAVFGPHSVENYGARSLFIQAQCIAPELIILRLVLGWAWTTDTMSSEPRRSTHSFIRFATAPGAGGSVTYDTGTLNSFAAAPEASTDRTLTQHISEISEERDEDQKNV